MSRYEYPRRLSFWERWLGPLIGVFTIAWMMLLCCLVVAAIRWLWCAVG